MTTGNNIKKKTVSNVSLHFVPSLQSAFCTLSAFCTWSAVCSLHFVLTGFNIARGVLCCDNLPALLESVSFNTCTVRF